MLKLNNFIFCNLPFPPYVVNIKNWPKTGSLRNFSGLSALADDEKCK